MQGGDGCEHAVERGRGAERPTRQRQRPRPAHVQPGHSAQHEQWRPCGGVLLQPEKSKLSCLHAAALGPDMAVMCWYSVTHVGAGASFISSPLQEISRLSWRFLGKSVCPFRPLTDGKAGQDVRIFGCK